MTPTVMNQRPVDPHVQVIPPVEYSPETESDSGKAERSMFDKAELAARVEKFRQHCADLQAEIKSLQDTGSDANAAEIAWREHQVVALTEFIEKLDQDDG